MCDRIKILVFCLVILPAQLFAGQSISIRSALAANQLPSNSVHRIYQDKEGFMWFGTMDGLCRYDGYRLIIFRSDSGNPELLTNNEITCMTEDDNNHLWIGTKSGLNILDKSTYRVTHLDRDELRGKIIRCILASSDGYIWVGVDDNIYRYDSEFRFIKNYYESLAFTSINSIYEDRAGNVWAMLWNNGLYKYDGRDDSFDKMPPVGEDDNPFRMYHDRNGNYWVGTWGDGLFRFRPEGKGGTYEPYHMYSHDSKVREDRFFSIVQDDKYGYLWLMSISGLHALEYTNDGDVKSVDMSYLFRESNNIFSEIVKDRTGNLWIGTFSEGVYTINFDRPVVRNYTIPSVKRQTGITTNITALYEDPDGDLWVNQNRWGLGVYDPREDRIRFYQDYPGIRGIAGFNTISCIAGLRSDPGNVWVGTENMQSIYILRKSRNDIVVTGRIDLSAAANNPGDPRMLFEDRKNNVWIATNNGLLVRPHNSKEIKPVSFSMGTITDITEDTRGSVWISSQDMGVFELQAAGDMDMWRPDIINYNSSNCGLKSGKVEAVYGDTNGKLWIGTKEGSVVVYDIITKRFEDLTQVLGVIDEGVLNIISDDYGHIWISTNKRLVRYNPSNGAIKEYVANNDDVLINSFLVNSVCRNAKGQILYGGNKGISVFSPSGEPSVRAKAPKTYISDVKVNNRSVFSGNDNRWLNFSEQSLVFEPDDKNIEIDFSTLDYTNARKIRYAYKMEGVDDDWIYAGNNRQFAIYNQLGKGRYTFKVKGMDENGLWSDQVTKLNIRKRPAYYETWWAYTVYVLLSLMIARAVFGMARKRIKLVNDLKIAQIEKEKSEELTQAKLRYFTNISHDFLTPLTILSCLIDDAEMTSKTRVAHFEPMRSNINRLRRLLQQVLDFRKAESGNMRLNISKGDIAMFIRDVCYENFMPLMKKKNIEFSFNSTPLHIEAWFDIDKVDKIVFNLLSNAFKFTPAGGKVSVELNKYVQGDEYRLVVKVRDTGVGISKEDMDKIFTRFYSDKRNEAAESNGIGLNLTKDLVELHKGTIQVESEQGAGTLFTVDIPISMESYEIPEQARLTDTVIFDGVVDVSLSESSIQENITAQAPAQSGDDANIAQVLLVEDNEELLYLIKNILSRHYNVMVAKNGADALSIIKDNDIDIVISDVMMPVMDGLELCRALKGNIETSHIPVILLTAKNSTEDRIECYNAGADGYLSKPFELKVLEARINNFMSNKKAKQQEFKSGFDINISALEYPSLDENFLNDALKIIEEHLSDTEFDVNAFAEKLCMSKSSLYRKLKTMTGLSPVEFIRNIRLKHACRILKAQAMPISDAAYMVGFSDPKYFTSCFKAEFGMTPSEFQKK